MWERTFSAAEANSSFSGPDGGDTAPEYVAFSLLFASALPPSSATPLSLSEKLSLLSSIVNVALGFAIIIGPTPAPAPTAAPFSGEFVISILGGL